MCQVNKILTIISGMLLLGDPVGGVMGNVEAFVGVAAKSIVLIGVFEDDRCKALSGDGLNAANTASERVLA